VGTPGEPAANGTNPNQQQMEAIPRKETKAYRNKKLETKTVIKQ
jgi:hypothetical protein